MPILLREPTLTIQLWWCLLKQRREDFVSKVGKPFKVTKVIFEMEKEDSFDESIAAIKQKFPKQEIQLIPGGMVVTEVIDMTWQEVELEGKEKKEKEKEKKGKRK